MNTEKEVKTAEEFLLDHWGQPLPAMEAYANQVASLRTQQLQERTGELSKALNEGRHYLMGVSAEDVTVEDALEAFGFGRNGLQNP